MNIFEFNENIRNEWKIAEKSRGCTYKTANISVVNALEYQNWVKISAKAQYFYHMIQYANNLISAFMDTDKTMRNYRQITVKVRGYTYKITHNLAFNYPRVANLVPY